MYLDAYFANKNTPKKCIWSVNYVYHLGWVNDDGKIRPYRNLLKHPEYLLSDTTQKYYPEFMTTLNALWKSTYTDKGALNPVEEWTPKVKAVKTTNLKNAETAVANAQTEYDSADKKTKAAKEKALKDAKTKLKAQWKLFIPTCTDIFAPFARSMWDRWSLIDRKYYPARGFDKDKALPATLQILDYIKISFSPTWGTTISQAGKGDVFRANYGAKKSATKKGKKKKRSVLEDDHPVPNPKKRSAPLPQRSEQPTYTFPVLSIDEENNLHDRENKGQEGSGGTESAAGLADDVPMKDVQRYVLAQ